MSLLERQVEFVAALRAAGLPVSVAEDIDAAQAFGAVDLLEREQLRWVLAAALVKRRSHRAAFDTLFDLYYPSATGRSEASSDSPDPPAAPGRIDPPGREGTSGPADRAAAEAERNRFREQLRQQLRDGDDAALTASARAAVAQFGAVRGAVPGTQSWSRYTTLSRVSPRTLLASLLEQALEGRERGGLTERTLRTTFNRRIARFEELVETEVSRRIAQERGIERVARTAVRLPVERRDLLSATSADLAEIRAEIAPLARRLAARMAIKQRQGRRGQLDFRRTIRASLSSGGVPIDTRHRPRRPHRTDLVVICDVSDSVASFARFTLLLVHALHEQFSRIRVFAFVDELAEVTEFFRSGEDVLTAVARIDANARVRGWYGRTDYGQAFDEFAQRFPRVIGARSSVLILGDARSNYGDPRADQLARIVAPARRAYWLNPERRASWDSGDSVATVLGEVVPMLECRNLDQLGRFVRDLV